MYYRPVLFIHTSGNRAITAHLHDGIKTPNGHFPLSFLPPPSKNINLWDLSSLAKPTIMKTRSCPQVPKSIDVNGNSVLEYTDYVEILDWSLNLKKRINLESRGDVSISPDDRFIAFAAPLPYQPSKKRLGRMIILDITKVGDSFREDELDEEGENETGETTRVQPQGEIIRKKKEPLGFTFDEYKFSKHGQTGIFQYDTCEVNGFAPATDELLLDGINLDCMMAFWPFTIKFKDGNFVTRKVLELVNLNRAQISLMRPELLRDDNLLSEDDLHAKTDYKANFRFIATVQRMHNFDPSGEWLALYESYFDDKKEGAPPFLRQFVALYGEGGKMMWNVNVGDIKEIDYIDGRYESCYMIEKDAPPRVLCVGLTFVRNKVIITGFADGSVFFLDFQSGKMMKSIQLTIPNGKPMIALTPDPKERGIWILEDLDTLRFIEFSREDLALFNH